MPWTLSTPESVDDLCDTLMKLSETSGYACRGQGRTFGRLTPSLDRILARSNAQTEKQCSDIEFRSIYVFHQQATTYLTPAESGHLYWVLNSLLLMQHFGAPTRLLDWTRSPWVAAYFCVLSNTDEEGEIWAFDAEELERRTASPVTNNILGAPMQKLWSQSRFDPTPEDWLAIYKPTGMNARMIAQQSVFTVAGLRRDHDQLIDKALDDPQKTRITVKPELKKSMQKRLFSMNITASALFPGVDGLGKYISQLMEMEMRTVDASATATLLAKTQTMKTH